MGEGEREWWGGEGKVRKLEEWRHIEARRQGETEIREGGVCLFHKQPP